MAGAAVELFSLDFLPICMCLPNFDLMILNCGPLPIRPPVLTRKGFLCKGILAWEDELPKCIFRCQRGFRAVFCLRSQLCNGMLLF